jgi:HK97 family phage prohead protease
MTEIVDRELTAPENGSEHATEPLRFRSGSQLGVNFPERLVEVVVSPYEEPALVEYRGRMISETIARGAYNGIQRRAKSSKPVHANRDHDITRPVGKVIAFHPSREEGLVAEVKVTRGTLGDETLELCEDGVLSISAGYRPKEPLRENEKWEGRNRVRILKAWLGHVAFTADPAYEGAKVLSVRSADELVEGEQISTPNLDIVRGWLLTDRFERYTPPSP